MKKPPDLRFSLETWCQYVIALCLFCLFFFAFFRAVTKLLEDLVFFVVDIPNNGQDVLEIMVNKPNRERQKLMREQNILKQVPSFPCTLSGLLCCLNQCSYSGWLQLLQANLLYIDLQAAAGSVHRQWRWTHAAAGGAGRPASCPIPTHLPPVLPGFTPFSAGLPQKSGTVWMHMDNCSINKSIFKKIKLWVKIWAIKSKDTWTKTRINQDEIKKIELSANDLCTNYILQLYIL